MTEPILFLKGFVKPHKRNGHDVKGYHRRDQASPARVASHPQKDHHGAPVKILKPSKPTPMASWSDPGAVATVVPGGEMPAQLNGVLLQPWDDAPQTDDGWEYVDGIMDDLDEPPLNVPPGKKAASGVIIEEPDGRVWLIHPTNRYGGYDASFPKGNAEPGMSFQANALKEVFEETGLKVQIEGLVGDYERTTTVARLYRGKRIGGTPSAMGWEAQAVSLVPKSDLYKLLNMSTDHGAAEAVGAGPKPKPAKSASQGGLFSKK